MEAKKLDGTVLKMIALFCMFIDHATEISLPYIASIKPEYQMPFFLIGRIIIGRIAFPIYAFLIAEGMIHTRNKQRYAIRMLLFAIISEIPFDLMVSGKIIDISHQNVYFTLCLSILPFAIADYSKKIAIFVTPFICVAAHVIRCDYGVAGILFIMALTLLRKNKKNTLAIHTVIGFVIIKIYLVIRNYIGVIYGLIPAAILYLLLSEYNGKREKQKYPYLFYAFYPVHLFLLYLVKAYFL